MLEVHDHCGRLSFVQFAEVVTEARNKANGGDDTAHLVANALESVLRLRIARVRALLDLESADECVVALVSSFSTVA